MKLKRVISAILVVVILISLLPEIEANAVVIDTEEKFRAYVESLGVPWDTPYGHANFSVFKKYNLIVYGSPHGDTKYSSVTGETEYRYLGYNRNGDEATNPLFPNDSPYITGNYENKNYIEIEGAERSWLSISQNLANYMLNSYLSYDGVTYNITVNSPKLGKSKALVVSPAGWLNSGAIRVQYTDSMGGIWYSTMSVPKMTTNDPSLNCTINGPDTVVIGSKQNYVYANYTATATADIEGTYIDPKQVTEIEVTIGNSVPKNSSGTFSLTTDTYSMRFDRATLGEGTHKIPLNASASVKSEFGDELYGSARKDITVIVEPQAEPALTATATIAPKKTVYPNESSVVDTNENITITAKLNDCTDLSNIKRITFYARKSEAKKAEEIVIEGSQIKSLTQTVTFENNAALKIPAADVLEYKQVDQLYKVNCQVEFIEPVAGYYSIMLKNAETLSASVSIAANAEFDIIYNSNIVTDGEFQIESTPYTVTLKDKSSGNIVKREWFYKDKNGSWVSITPTDDQNCTDFDYDIDTTGTVYFKLRLNGDDKYTKEHTVAAVIPPPPQPDPDPEPPQPDNKAPKAVIDAPLVRYVDDSIDVSGAKSYDEDGSIVSYTWKTDGASGNIKGVSGTLSYSTPGEYQIELVVTDDKGATGKAVHTITIEEKPKPPKTNKPPEIILDAPDVVRAGEPFYVNAYAKDSDGTIAKIIISLDDHPEEIYTPPTLESEASHYIKGKFNEIGRYSTWAGAIDNEGDNCYERSSILVVEPVPYAYMTVKGIKKVNRKVTLSAALSDPDSDSDYPVDHSKNIWVIEPLFTLEKGKTVQDYIKTNAKSGVVYSDTSLTITGGEEIDLLFKIDGNFKATLTVQNYYTPKNVWLSDTTTKVITIEKDIAPVAQIDTTTLQYRDYSNYNYATFRIDDILHSEDGDNIGYYKLSYIHDSNNNGIYGDNGEKTVVAKEFTSESAVANRGQVTLDLMEVGKYKIMLDIKDSIPDDKTIKEFLSDADYLSSYSEIEVEVDNLAPRVNIDMTKKRKVELNVVYDYTSGLNGNDVEDLINAKLVPTLSQYGIELSGTTIQSAETLTPAIYSDPPYAPYPDNEDESDVAAVQLGVAAPYDIEYVEVANGYELRVIDLRNNTYKVVNTLQKNKFGKPVVVAYNDAYSYVYVISKTNYYNEEIWCVDATTGNILWTIDRPVLYVAKSSGIVYRLSYTENVNSVPVVVVNEDDLMYVCGIYEYDYDVYYYYGGNNKLLYTKINPLTGETIYEVRGQMQIPEDDGNFENDDHSYGAVYSCITDRLVEFDIYYPNSYNATGTLTFYVYSLPDNKLLYSKTFTYEKMTRQEEAEDEYDEDGYVYEPKVIPLFRFMPDGSLVFAEYNANNCGLVKIRRYDQAGNLIADKELTFRCRAASADEAFIRKCSYGDLADYSVCNQTFNLQVSTDDPLYYGRSRYVWYIYDIANDTITELNTITPELEKDDPNDLSPYINHSGEMEVVYPCDGAIYYFMFERFTSPSTLGLGSIFPRFFKYENGTLTEYERELAGEYDSDARKALKVVPNDYGVIKYIYVSSWVYYIHSKAYPQVIKLVSRDKGANFKNTWQDDTEHICVVISKKDNLDEVVGIRNLTALLNNDAALIEMVKPSMQTVAEKHIALNNGKGQFIDNTSYDDAFIELAKYIIGGEGQDLSTTWLIAGEDYEIETVAQYDDPEHDPKYAERWKYVHDPYHLDSDTPIDNPMEMMPGSGEYTTTPVVQFTQAGKYEITVSVQDNPSSNEALASYRKWSDENLSKKIVYVHRRPVAQFTVTKVQQGSNFLITAQDNGLSYDPDHTLLPNKGIVEWEWKWKEESETEWHIGRINNTLPANKTYIISLRVKDTDNGGTWSKPTIQVVSTTTDAQRPVAQFTVTPNPLEISDILTVNDTSYTLGSDTITERQWVITKNGTAINGYTSSAPASDCKTNYSDTGTGSYVIYLRVKSSNGLWSHDGDYTTWAKQELTVYKEDTTAPTLAINPKTAGWTNQDIDVVLSALDTGGSGFKETRYVINTSSSAPSESALIQSSNGASTVITLMDEGIWYIHGQAYDNRNNKSSIVSGGPYKIDKTAPTGVGTLSTTSWTNSNVTITFNASDTGGSGVKRIKKPDGIWVNAASTTYTVSENGTYTFTIEDNAGNKATVPVNVSNIDKSYPAGRLIPESSSWVNTNINVKFEVIYTGISGLKYWRYRISSNNGTSWGAWSSNQTEMTGTIELINQGIYKIEVELCNNANTKVTITSGSYCIDKTAPTGAFNPNNAEWTNKDISVVFTPIDTGGSGVDKWAYRISNNNGDSWGEWCQYIEGDTKGTIILSEQGILLIQAEIFDKAGNKGTVVSGEYKIDKIAPGVSADINTRPWSYEDVTVQLSYQDAGGSGLKDSLYAWSKETKTPTVWNKYTAPVNQTDNGSWYLHYRVTDNAGNEKTGYFGPYQIDKIAPSGQFVPPESGWTNNNMTITFTPTDDGGSGVLKWRYRASSNNGTSYGEWSEYYGNTAGGINLAAQGIWQLQAEVIDNAGNVSVVYSGSYKIDKTPPSVTASISSKAWTNTDVNVELTYTDNGGSGLKDRQYFWEKDTTPPRSWNNYGDTALTQSDEGIWYLHYRVSDYAGNTVTGYFGAYQIDKTAPTGQGILSPSEWTNKDVTITFTAHDEGGGGVKGIIKPDGTFVTAESITYTVGSNGTYTFMVEDNAGNQAVIPVNVANIDKIAPTGIGTLSPSEWTNKDVTITFIAKDEGGSGVKGIIKPDGTFVTAESTTYTVGSNGTYTFMVEDNAGNQAIIPVNVTNIDKIAPTGIGTLSPSEWTNKDVTITFTAYDEGGSGVKGILKPDGTWTSADSSLNGPDGSISVFTTEYTVSSNGMYNFTVEDNAGNQAVIPVNVANIDKILPSGLFTPEFSNWTKNDISVEFNPSDEGGSGVKQWRYRISGDNGITWQSWSDYIIGDTESIITLSLQGIWKIQTEVYDNAGNMAMLESGTYYIDKTLPSGTFNPDSGGWTNSSITAEFNPSDEGGSGVLRWRYRTSSDNGISWSTWSSYILGDTNDTITMSSQGVWLIEAEVTDCAGNMNTIISGTYKIDKTPPGGSFNPEGCIWVNSPRTTTFYPSDTGGSGVNKWRFRVSKDNGSTWQDWSDYITGGTSLAINFPSAGIWLAQAEVIDNAGNVNVVTSHTFEIDMAPPTGIFNPYDSDWTNENIAIEFRASDEGGSGISQIRYRKSSDRGENFGEWISYPISSEESGGAVSCSSIIIDIAEEGQWIVEAEATDNAGNVALIKSGIYKIDKTTPEVEATPEESNVVHLRIPVDINLKDKGGSGLKEMRYSWTKYTSRPDDGWVSINLTSEGDNASRQVLLKDEGTYYLYVEVLDVAGNLTCKNFGPYTLAYPKVEIYFKAVNKNEPDTNTVPAGEQISVTDINDTGRGVRIISNIPLEGAYVYLNGTKAGELVLNMPDIVNEKYTYRADIFDTVIPATMPDGIYKVTIDVQTILGTHVYNDSKIIVRTPVNLEAWIENTAEGQIYSNTSMVTTPAGVYNSILTMYCDNIFAATVSKYVNEVKVEFYDNAAGPDDNELSESFLGSMTLTKYGEEGIWKAVSTIEEDYFRGVETGKLKFLATTTNLNSETIEMSYYISRLKLDNFRITAIGDPNWQKYFEFGDGSPTELQKNGIATSNMPVSETKENNGIKLGYMVWFEIDSIGMHKEGSSVNIDVSYYATDSNNLLYEADIYIPDENWNFVLLNDSEYLQDAGSIRLNDTYRFESEKRPENKAFNTWRFEYFLPANAKVVKKGEPLDLYRDNTFKGKLLVVFDIKGINGDGYKYDYTKEEKNWGDGDGSEYGENEPTGLELLGKGQNKGEVFWYRLYETLFDDIDITREW